MISVGRSGCTLGQPTKHVRTHIHKLKPLNHFTMVPHPRSSLGVNSDDGEQGWGRRQAWAVATAGGADGSGDSGWRR